MRARRAILAPAALVAAALVAAALVAALVQPLAAARSAPLAAARSAPAGLARSTVSTHRVQPQPRAGACRYRGRGLFALPDPRCTPGAIDPAVTQADIQRTICLPGYAARIRPPDYVAEVEKRLSMEAYGARKALGAYEYDHLVALELGGARNDPRNLWPEPVPARPGPTVKDELEGRLRTMVCEGRLRLAQAQLMIARDWIRADHRYG